uniref:Uncharacterized protein n=1 Tax=Sphaerodactylus townsendi TaxID=933632 RepID=A0ACB8EAC0_9SAUR
MSNRVPIISPEDLESITLTRAGFGFILKAFHTPRNTDVALKLLTCKSATDRDLKALLEDVAGIQHVNCERLIPSIGIYHFQGLLGVVTEWMHNGSLHSLIHEHELYLDLPLPLCIRILTDVAEGLGYLHSLEHPILHHSLKPSNVLLDLEYRAKFWNDVLGKPKQTEATGRHEPLPVSTSGIPDCKELLQDVLGMFSKEMISDAIYNLIHAKDCATDAAKSPVSHGLEIDLRNLEASSLRDENRQTKKITLEAQSLPDIHLKSSTHTQEKEAKQTLHANASPPNTALEKGTFARQHTEFYPSVSTPAPRLNSCVRDQEYILQHGLPKYLLASRLTGL